MNKRYIEREVLHAHRVKTRAARYKAKRSEISPERAKGVTAHFVAAFRGRPISAEEWGDLHKASSARIKLVQP